MIKNKNQSFINNNFNFHAYRVEVSPLITLAIVAILFALYLDWKEEQSKLSVSWKRPKYRRYRVK